MGEENCPVRLKPEPTTDVRLTPDATTASATQENDLLLVMFSTSPPVTPSAPDSISAARLHHAITRRGGFRIMPPATRRQAHRRVERFFATKSLTAQAGRVLRTC